MSRSSIDPLMVESIQELNEEKRIEFQALGTGGRYTRQQKQYAFKMIYESGMRATARVLNIPRRTLQRWCRDERIYVRRCPSWVYDWAERRRKCREFWQRRGYG